LISQEFLTSYPSAQCSAHVPDRDFLPRDAPHHTSFTAEIGQQ
jgi:hypothetical protein